MIRLFLLAGLVAVSACAAPSASTEPTHIAPASTLEKSAHQVDDALSELSLRLSTQLTDDHEDLILAWNDFEGDVRSVVNDLIRNPARVDIDGMQKRVESLGELLDDSPLDLPSAEWEEFTSAFQELIEDVSESGDTA